MAEADCALTCEENVALDANFNTNSTKIEISSSPSVANRYKRKNVKIYIAVIILLFIICTILLGLLLGMRYGETAKVLQKGVDKPSANISELVCLSEDCVYTASEILHALDKTVDPCEDFYLYACGGWIKNNPIPDNLPSWNQPLALSKKNNNLFKRLIVEQKTRQKYSENEAVTKMFIYYDACVNTSQIGSVGGKPLRLLMAKYDLWNATDPNWNESSWNLLKNLAEIHRDLRVMPLFKVAAEPDYKNSSRNIITFNQPSHMISRKTMLGSTQEDEVVKEAYTKLMNGLVSLMRDPKQNYSRAVEEIFLFERNLSKISITREMMSEKSKMYKAKTVKELTLETGGKINWLEYLKILCTNVDYEIKEDTVVVTFALSYLKDLATLMARTPKRIIANYMMWTVIQTLARDLTPAFTSHFETYDRVTSGSTSKKPRWQFCLSELNDDENLLGDPLGLVFVEKTFSGDNKKQVIEMINHIRDAFIDSVRTLDWMDNITKKAAEKKAERLNYNIGYPDYILEKEKLTKKYAKLSIEKNNYFNNVVELRRFTMQTMLEGLNQPTSKNKWFTHPQTVNAFYDVNNNKMVFPAGILRPPFYRKYPRSVSYGGIGSVIAHEITHGFDNNGRRFNSDGDMVNWWTQASNDAFEKKTKCMISQYSNFTVYGRKTNGKQTLGENIADNNAILQSFRAFKKWQQMNKKEPPLPGMNLSHDQLFFVSAAQIDCGDLRPEHAREWIDRKSHSLEYVRNPEAQIVIGSFNYPDNRVTGVMRNSEDFAKAFSCQIGSPMNPTKKCKVW